MICPRYVFADGLFVISNCISFGVILSKLVGSVKNSQAFSKEIGSLCSEVSV